MKKADDYDRYLIPPKKVPQHSEHAALRTQGSQKVLESFRKCQINVPPHMYWVCNLMSGAWLLHDKGTTVPKAHKRIPF